jgi:NADP-dependent 3-hydroxy acid dehydrogenase YdfG
MTEEQTYNKSRKEEARQAVDALVDSVRFMNFEKMVVEAFEDKLATMHRTNIQTLMGVFKDVIEHYAQEHSADLRNEDSLVWAKKVSKLDTGSFRYI